jgi:protein-L-isoaspartate O-methyltransferase
MNAQTRLVQILENKGVLPVDWRAAVAAVDRGLFIPGVLDGGDGYDAANAMPDDAGPESRQRLVYDDVPIVTQVNCGKPTLDGEFGVPTSSSSMPSIMLEMLTLLDVRAGHRVLELGTGTGYNAAWLCHRLGDLNVTTVEVDPSVLATATANLESTGYRPTVVEGNGRDGHRPGAPYERILCTFAVRDIPPAWLAQCPDGRIVTPWGSSFFNGSFATLDVVNGVARGGFSGDPAFMWDRTSGAGTRGRIENHGNRDDRDDRRRECAQGSTGIPPQNVVQDDPAFFIGLHVTDARWRWIEADGGGDGGDGEATLRIAADDGRSGATVDYVPGRDTYVVEQFGPRALWDEVEAAFLRWHELGKPERSRFGLSVDASGQRVWLDDPREVIRLTK